MKNAPRFRLFGVVFIIFSILVAIPAVRLGLFAFRAYQPEGNSSVTIEVRKGQSPSEVIRNLMSQGIIADSQSFMWLGRLTKQWKKIKAGEYQVSPNMTPLEILATLSSGVSIAHPVTVREGENIYELAKDLESKKLANSDHFLNLCKDIRFISSLGIFSQEVPTSLEGYFFPDTYFFNRSLSETDMIRQMVRHFVDSWPPQYTERAQELGLSRHQVVTLASIIEKETGAPEERPLISSVFHNRLRKKMRLQSDPTTIYGMWDHYHGKIHRSNLLEKNDYNTYFIEALPIGPIGNPGKESIQAALYPANSPFLFFVSHNDGTHEFSKTLEEHNRFVKKFQLDPQARAGKSWRDRLKKPMNVPVPFEIK